MMCNCLQPMTIQLINQLILHWVNHRSEPITSPLFVFHCMLLDCSWKWQYVCRVHCLWLEQERKAGLEIDSWVNIKHSSGQHCDIINRNLCCTPLSFRWHLDRRQRRDRGIQIRRRDKWMGRDADRDREAAHCGYQIKGRDGRRKQLHVCVCVKCLI